jgi:acyl-coenzyme A thioesterase PaaI-like protein
MTEPDLRQLHADARAHFMTTMNFEHDLDDHRAWGAATIDSYLCTAPGWPGVAALLTFADVLIGRLAAERTAPRISVTADLTLHVLGTLPPDGRLSMRASLIKTGRSMSVGETEIVAVDTGRPVATSIGTFLASPRPMDEAPSGLRSPPTRDRAEDRVAPTLAEQVGLTVPEPGVAEISLRPDLLNATDSLQGGLIALLGEIAAQTAATRAVGVPQVVDSLEVHYLAAARVGPFRATGQVRSSGGGRTLVRVEVCDPGRDNRMASVILASTRAAPGV